MGAMSATVAHPAQDGFARADPAQAVTAQANSAQAEGPHPTRGLPGLDAHRHAAAVLGAALAPGGRLSHAYLFHGPAGSGKRTVARAFAAALVADEEAARDGVAQRIARGVHPDVTWVTPSGAAEMLVSDIEEPVVAAAARTPFESSRRVFVIEAVDTMNDQTANRMLKTLEEPPSFVHIVLLTDRPQDVLATISSRCQPVRFDPLPSASIEEGLRGAEAGEAGGQSAAAWARLALGDARLAAWLASGEGRAVRASAESFVRGALRGDTAQREWTGLLDAAKAAGVSAGEELAGRVERELELLPSRERRRHEREATDARRRIERRVRTRTLDVGLRVAELWLRDVLCVAQGAGELVHAVDRREELEHDARGRSGAAVGRGVELVAQTRLRLALNVSEELAVEALAYRLRELLGSRDG